MLRNRLTLSLLVIAAFSVNAHADGVCSPEPRGNPALCQKFTDALYTIKAIIDAGKPHKQAMIDFGLVSAQPGGVGWLTAQVNAWNYQKVQEQAQQAYQDAREDARQERQTRAIERQARAIELMEHNQR